ncbi:MAG: hypothetical protein K6A74_06135 [Lachnospiraceae bacterium]|nr:hypothetical protein [Lachnospiraceae bacterium]
MKEKKIDLNLILNMVIVILTIVGTIVMINSKASATGLTANGFRNLKFYTVLSNEFAGVIALCQIIAHFRGKPYLKVTKLVAVTAVTLTFLVVAGFFGPLYGWLKLYKQANFYFHLVVPLVCMVEFFTAKNIGDLTIKHCMIASLSTVVYGLAYLINILINGVGVWPESNDWYGFLNWGMPVGLTIFAGIILTSFGVACLLRFIKKKIKRAS